MTRTANDGASLADRQVQPIRRTTQKIQLAVIPRKLELRRLVYLEVHLLQKMGAQLTKTVLQYGMLVLPSIR